MSKNYEIDSETNHIIYDDDWYFNIDKVSHRRPKITGSPSLVYDKFRLYLGRNKLTRRPSFGVMKTPNECSIYHVLNYPVRKWGSPQISFVGRYGYAKSRLMSWVLANWLAQKHRIFQFDDAELEGQNLAWHGYFDKNELFHPFIINIWIPKGYKFNEKAENFRPLHTERNNVFLREFSKVDEIVQELKPHILNIIYRPAFIDACALILLLDLIKIIKTKTSKSKSYVFVRHELGDLFPESPSGDMYHLTREIALQEIRKFRKYRIGILTSFHASYDVLYTIGQKFGFVGQVRPILHKSMSLLEQEARSYKRGEFALGNGGYFRKHHLKEFPISDIEYHYTSNDIQWLYPDMIPFDKEDKEGKLPKTVKDITQVFLAWQEGQSGREISRNYGLTHYSVVQMIKEFEGHSS